MIAFTGFDNDLYYIITHFCDDNSGTNATWTDIAETDSTTTYHISTIERRLISDFVDADSLGVSASIIENRIRAQRILREGLFLPAPKVLHMVWPRPEYNRKAIMCNRKGIGLRISRRL